MVGTQYNNGVTNQDLLEQHYSLIFRYKLFIINVKPGSMGDNIHR